MKKHYKLLLLAGMVIVGADLVNYKIYIDNKGAPEFSFVPSFLCTVVVGVVGYFAWKQYPTKWPAKIWLLVYTAYLSIFLPITFINAFVFTLPAGVINFITSIRNLPNGPMPLLILYFLATYIPVGAVGVKGQAVNVDITL